MGQIDKIKADFLCCEGVFPYRKFKKLLVSVGFDEVKRSGHTGGSRRAFYNKQTGQVMFLHEPHDGTMRPAMVRDKRQFLIEGGYL